MPSTVRLRGLDNHTWRTATWLTPFVAPVLLGVMIAILWLLGKLPAFEVHERPWFLTGVVGTVIASLAISMGLLTSPSSQFRAVALSIAGSSAIVLVGSFIYFMGLRW
jgi:uncharacterized membrane protein